MQLFAPYINSNNLNFIYSASVTIIIVSRLLKPRLTFEQATVGETHMEEGPYGRTHMGLPLIASCGGGGIGKGGRKDRKRRTDTYSPCANSLVLLKMQN